MKTNSKALSKKIRVADFIVDFLVKNGIKDIFVLTGYGAMYLNDAIVSNKNINYFCVRNEAASPMMAEAYARAKPGLGAVCLTAGPGSTNAIPGLAEAWVDSAPIIIISGQVHRAFTTYNAKLPGLRTFGTAEINIIPIVKPLTKYAEMVNDPKLVLYHLEKALFFAKEGRPGPVWLDIPHDVQATLIEPRKLKRFTPPKAKVNNLKIKPIIKLLQESRRPLIIAGHGIKLSKAIEEFNQMIKILEFPVLLTRFAIDIIPYSNPLNMGLGGIRGTKINRIISKRADTVLVLGSRLAIPFVGLKKDSFNSNSKIIALDIEKDELKKRGVKIHYPILCDVKQFILEFNKAAKTYAWDKKSWLADCQRLKKDFPVLTRDLRKNPIDLYYFMSRLDHFAKKNNILVTDSGSNYYIGGQVWKFENGQREITSGTFGAMGLSVPLAIGASIAQKNFQILAVTGDGSLELNIQELKTMSYYNLNIKLFVINNGGYVSMRRWQDTYFNGRRIGSDKKTGAEIINLRKVADAFSLDYESIKKWQEIDGKIQKVMLNKKPMFIEVFCDNEQKLIEPIEKLPNEYQSA